MKGARFKVYQDDAEQWRWRLQSANGRILADSGEGYTRKWAAERAVQTVKMAVLYFSVDQRAVQRFRAATDERFSGKTFLFKDFDTKH